MITFGGKPHVIKSTMTGIRRILAGNNSALEVFDDIEHDVEIQTMLERGNDIIVNRLHYNDHGRVHSLISALASLGILSLLKEGKVRPHLMSEKQGTWQDAQTVVMAAAYLHDVGNVVSRDLHYYHSAYLMNRPMKRILEKYYEGRRLHVLHALVLEGIFTHDENVGSYSVEAGAVAVGDGVDMAEGRARTPYQMGKSDIHAVSALAIDRVSLTRGPERPVRIIVEMNNPAGVFQIEKVMGPKIRTSGIAAHVEVLGRIKGKKAQTFRFQSAS